MFVLPNVVTDITFTPVQHGIGNEIRPLPKFNSRLLAVLKNNYGYMNVPNTVQRAHPSPQLPNMSFIGRVVNIATSSTILAVIISITLSWVLKPLKTSLPPIT
jgi:hypothetical protein